MAELVMRSAEQIGRTVADYHDYRARERERTLAALLAELKRAAAAGAAWYRWTVARAERRHEHGLADDRGRAIACPYPGCDRFWQLDVLELEPWVLAGFDAVHASPPCQAYSVAHSIWKRDHPRLIEPVRDLLRASGRPYVIENVPGAPLLDAVTVCGLSVGVNVKRHRLFESSVSLMVPPCHSGHAGDWLLVWGHTVQERGHVTRRGPNGNTTHRRHVGTERGRVAMGIDWMTRDELSEAVPPAYTELIGAQLMAAIS